MSNTSENKIDHLKEDPPIQGQAFCCISFLSPERITNSKIRGLKIRGVYSSEEAAKKRAKELQEVDPHFDVYVGEVGKWLPWNPDPNSIEDHQYAEQELQDLAEGYKDNRRKAKRHHEERIDESKNRAMAEEKSKKQKQIERLQRKLREKSQKKEEQKFMEDQKTAALKQALEQQQSSTQSNVKVETIDTEDDLELGKQERDRLQQNAESLKEREENLGTVDSKLDKLRSLYDQLNAKKQKLNNSTSQSNNA
jgi:DNA repair exonuclease SbcCD ATPase subunit